MADQNITALMPNKLNLTPPDSDAGDGSSTDAPQYSFDGYTIEVSQKVALTPFAGHRERHDNRDRWSTR